jgi:hypothetical protein
MLADGFYNRHGLRKPRGFSTIGRKICKLVNLKKKGPRRALKSCYVVNGGVSSAEDIMKISLTR